MRSPYLDSARPAGFTLAELLVAMAVLSVILVLVAQMVGGATTATSSSQRRINADSQARHIFDKMAMDLARMVNRPDVDFLAKGSDLPNNSVGGTMVGNDEILFYSSTPGYFSGASAPALGNVNPVSLVGYAMAEDANGSPALFRLAKGLGLEPGAHWKGFSFLPITLRSLWSTILDRNSGPNLGMVDPDFQIIGDAVVRFEYSYILKPDAIGTAVSGKSPSTISILPYGTNHLPEHTSSDFHRDVAALVVTLALVDPSSRVIIEDYTDLTGNTLFQDAVAGELPDDAWTQKLHAPNFARDAGIPPAAASAVRVYRRHLNLGTGQ